MEKKKIHVFGKDAYLLGKEKNGKNCYLEAGKFDCNWYWGIGYIETYTNEKNPEKSKDIDSHRHFNILFFNGINNSFDKFKDFFAETPFTDDEIWKILELMQSAYTARKYSDMLYRGGAHYTINPAKESIQNNAEYDRINKVVIPSILEELYKILND